MHSATHRLSKVGPGKPPLPANTNPRRRWTRAAVALLLLMIPCVWYMMPSARLNKARQMQEELFSMSAEQLSPDERKQRFEALRAVQDKLSQAERQELRKDMGQLMQKKMNADAVKYLAMAPAERRKVIDDRIAREQKWQKAASQSGGNKTPPKKEGGQGNAKGKGGSTTAPRGPSSPEDRDTRRREFLLHASPAARAGMDLMRLEMATRRAQLGLPPAKGFGFGGR